MVFMILCGLLINSSFSWGIRILIYPLNTTHVLSSKLPESVYIATNRLSYKKVMTERRIVTTVEGRALSIRAAWYHAFALARVMESLVDVARGLSPAIAIISVLLLTCSIAHRRINMFADINFAWFRGQQRNVNPRRNGNRARNHPIESRWDNNIATMMLIVRITVTRSIKGLT